MLLYFTVKFLEVSDKSNCILVLENIQVSISASQVDSFVG